MTVKNDITSDLSALVIKDHFASVEFFTYAFDRLSLLLDVSEKRLWEGFVTASSFDSHVELGRWLAPTNA